MTIYSCPLCQNLLTQLYHEDRQRVYRQCLCCKLVFVPPAYHLSAQAEKAEYDLHQNSPHDMGYRRFLSRLFEPMQARLPAASVGLDFGSGPGPTLSEMFKEAGHTMQIYDIYYAKNHSVWEHSYDFITSSEVVEHLHRPHEELQRLWTCLKPNGFLGIMTKLVIDQTAFASWHYKNDLTHVCFFSRPTFNWIGVQWGCEPEFVADDVTIFRKPELD
ncbi:class I SAM-dependent methyltransferase [Anaerolineales bacterium HSG6]|nr:class I SAM-dependent methyltransferase [Anaerolineales bacterium HSG6]